ncbi:hypothetical protein Syun_011436 [Stephania yunnanensis]|uniref:Uncharacterized protein n=1 Tax=Stephania yunnanensis TaxID=152371 RepID=A0AAP0JXS8_9MAGN
MGPTLIISVCRNDSTVSVHEIHLAMRNYITAEQSRDVNSRASLVRFVSKLQCDEIPKSRDAVDQCIGSARLALRAASLGFIVLPPIFLFRLQIWMSVVALAQSSEIERGRERTDPVQDASSSSSDHRSIFLLLLSSMFFISTDTYGAEQIFMDVGSALEMKCSYGRTKSPAPIVPPTRSRSPLTQQTKKQTLTACSSPNPDLLTQLSSSSVRLSRTTRPHGHGPHAQPHGTICFALSPGVALAITPRALCPHAKCFALSPAALCPTGHGLTALTHRLCGTAALPHGSRPSRLTHSSPICSASRSRPSRLTTLTTLMVSPL